MFKYILTRLKSISAIQAFAGIITFTILVFVVKYFGIKEDFRYIRVEVIKKNWVENYAPYGYRTPYWLSDKIKIGQTEKNAAGKVTAQVIGLENYLRGGEESEVYISLKIRAIQNKQTGRYTYKDLPIDLGNSIDITIDTINIKGQIIDDNYPPLGYPTKYFSVVARARNLTPAIIKQLKPGLKMYNRADNDVIAQFLDVKFEPSTLQTAVIDQAKALVFNRDQNQDAIINLKIKAYQIDNRWFFSGHQNLKISNDNEVRLYIYTDQINLYGLEIEQINEL